MRHFCLPFAQLLTNQFFRVHVNGEQSKIPPGKARNIFRKISAEKCFRVNVDGVYLILHLIAVFEGIFIS